MMPPATKSYAKRVQEDDGQDGFMSRFNEEFDDVHRRIRELAEEILGSPGCPSSNASHEPIKSAKEEPTPSTDTPSSSK